MITLWRQPIHSWVAISVLKRFISDLKPWDICERDSASTKTYVDRGEKLVRTRTRNCLDCIYINNHELMILLFFIISAYSINYCIIFFFFLFSLFFANWKYSVIPAFAATTPDQWEVFSYGWRYESSIWFWRKIMRLIPDKMENQYLTIQCLTSPTIIFKKHCHSGCMHMHVIL